VQLRRGGRPAGQDERAQRRQPGVHLVARLFEPGGLARGEPQPFAIPAVRHGQVSPDVEQVVLDVSQLLGRLGGQVGQRQRQAELRVELVDRAVRLDPRVRLGHPAHVSQMRLAGVSEAGVDPGEVDGHGAPPRYHPPRTGRWPGKPV
jgi:hypothetical protein